MAKPLPIESFKGYKKALTLNGMTFGIGPQVSTFKTPPGSGTIYLSTAGQVFEGYDCRGRDIVVNADNVTVRSCLINATSWYALNNTAGKRGFVAEFNLLDGEKANNQNAAMFASEAGDTVFKNNIVLYAPTDMVIMVGGLCEHNVLAGSYYQDGAHADAFSIGKSLGPMVFRANYVDFTTQPDGKGNANSCIKVVSHFGPIEDVLIEGNILLGGGYNMYCGTSPNPVNNVRVVNNLYGLSTYGAGKPDGFIVGGGVSGPNGTNFKNTGNNQFSTAPDGVVSVSATGQPSTPTLPPVTPPAPSVGPPKVTAKPVIDHGGIGERASTTSGQWENLGSDSVFSWQWFLNGHPLDSKTHEVTPQEAGQLELIVSVNAPGRGVAVATADPVQIAGPTPVTPPVPLEPPPVVVPPVVTPPAPAGLTLSDADVLEIKTALVTIAKKIGA